MYYTSVIITSGSLESGTVASVFVCGRIAHSSAFPAIVSYHTGDSSATQWPAAFAG